MLRKLPLTLMVIASMSIASGRIQASENSVVVSKTAPLPPRNSENPKSKLEVFDSEAHKEREKALKRFGRIPASYSLSIQNSAEEVIVSPDGNVTIVHH